MGSDERETKREPGVMTVRTSRDGGRTWSGTRTTGRGDPERIRGSIAFPPCECRRCLDERAEAVG